MNITIIGQGIISAIGRNVAETTLALRHQRSGIHPLTLLNTCHRGIPAGEVPYSNTVLAEQLGITTPEVSRTVLLGITAIREAWQSSKVDKDMLCGLRTALVSGTSVGGMDITEQHFSTITTAADIAFLRYHTCDSTTQRIASYFPEITDSLTVSTACSSAMNAIIVGAEMLLCDEADIVVVGGTEALTMFHLNGFLSLMIVSDKACQPFDKCRSGLTLGEGAAYIVMCSETTAKRLKSAIYGYLLGYGNACDAYHQTAFSPNAQGAFLAMSEAIQRSGIKKTDIHYINAHGTATDNNDSSETIAMQRVFLEHMPAVSSTKGFTGHTTSAAGAIETVISLIAIQENILPANIGFTTPMDNGIIPTMGRSHTIVDTVLCNSFGFGGNDSSIILSRYPRESLPVNKSLTMDDIEVLSTAEVNAIDELSGLQTYVSPIESRRMCTLMKASLLSSLQALDKAEVSSPDAIIVITAYGNIALSESLLTAMVADEANSGRPSYFMNSTHNTLASTIAIKTHCYGYNITLCDDNPTIGKAMMSALRVMATTGCKTILVTLADEATPLFTTLFTRLGKTNIRPIHSLSLLLSCGK